MNAYQRIVYKYYSFWTVKVWCLPFFGSPSRIQFENSAAQIRLTLRFEALLNVLFTHISFLICANSNTCHPVLSCWNVPVWRVRRSFFVPTYMTAFYHAARELKLLRKFKRSTTTRMSAKFQIHRKEISDVWMDFFSYLHLCVSLTSQSRLCSIWRW